MMLHRPERVETRLLGIHHLIHHLVKYLILAFAVFEWACHLNFIENADVHTHPPLLSSVRQNPCGHSSLLCLNSRSRAMRSMVAPLSKSLRQMLTGSESNHTAPGHRLTRSEFVADFDGLRSGGCS